MPVGELLLGALIKEFISRLLSPELVQFLRQEGFETRINKWRRILEIINALLVDAEEKQLRDSAVKIWLDDLEYLAYDADDMLDEFEYEAVARKVKIDQLQSGNFLRHIPAGFCSWSLDAIRFRVRMRSMVDSVTNRFDQLCQLRDKLGLQAVTVGESSISTAAPRRPPASSLPTGAVYGRDADKRKIVELVMNNGSGEANILVVPIVGMGGVGKTTLAREVYNHPDVVESFDVKAWVCVSDGDFDVTRVSMSILMDITGSTSDHKDFNTVQRELKQRISQKKFLLVLDDVWSISYANRETLLSPFMESAFGSRIIVTTRLEPVASTFTLTGFHALDGLSDDDCWSVFLMCLSERSEAVLAHPHLKFIQKSVIEKCKALPLAAKALGGLLRLKQIDDWLKILESSLWNQWENDEHGIPAALRLSYHHLPSHSHCAIFPKDHEYKIEDVVILWIAEGMVQKSIENEHLEELGYKYFYDLLGRSLFQQSSRGYDQTFVMHDLIHDLAQWALRGRRLSLDSVSSGSSGQLEKVGHLSYISGEYDCEKRFKIFQKFEDLKVRIRTFLPIAQDTNKKYIANSIPFTLLPKLKRLRVLSLESYCVAEIPVSMGGLKHLRYLNLSRTTIRSLPESTCQLYNLQILMLRDCSRLKKLPSNFKYLIRLCHLDIEGAILIKWMPMGMKYLQNLQKLSHFIVGEDGKGSSLKELMSLNMLHGKLYISKLDNVIDHDHNDLILRDKELKELLLQWGSHFHKLRREAREEKVLTMLQPHENIQKLTIECYGGMKFPSWIGDQSYLNIKVLRLKDCARCTSLPSLGVLVSLEELTIEGMEGLKHIKSEFCGSGTQLFKSLKTLCFEEMQIWTDWEPIEENECGVAFPCLKMLSIVKCPQLSGTLPKCLVALENLVIKDCDQLVVSFSYIPEVCKIEIDGCKKIASENPMELKSIKYLELSNISEFSNQLMQECFGKAELQEVMHNRCEAQMDKIFPEKPRLGGLHSIKLLKEMVLSNCSSIISFPEVCFLPYLSKLQIQHCNALVSLPEEMKIKNACLDTLEIWSCNSLQFIVRGQLPPSLKILNITDCEKLESLCYYDKENDKNTKSSFVETLYIARCDSLAFIIRAQLPLSLKRLEIIRCEKLESLWDDGELKEDRSTNSSLLEYLKVWDCPSLSSNIQLPATVKRVLINNCAQLTTVGGGFLDSNMSLEEITIWDCEKLLKIPSGLNQLRNLQELTIWNCPVEYFPVEGLAGTKLKRLEIQDCKELKAIPIGLHSLSSLEDLVISRCSSIVSFSPEEEFPTSLKSLEIADCESVYSSLINWGLQNLTSLTFLRIWGCQDVETFPQQEMEMSLPPSLSILSIVDFHNLKQLWIRGFQNITSLQSLSISLCTDLTSLGGEGLPSSLTHLMLWGCPNLTCFPEQGLPSSLEKLEIDDCQNLMCFPNQGLPSSLQSVDIRNCPKLGKVCRRKKGREWPKLSNIPYVFVDDTEEDEDQPHSRSPLTNPFRCCKDIEDDTSDSSSSIDS